MIERIKQSLKSFYGMFFFYLFRIFSLQNKVVFSSFSGKVYGDNPKIISMKLHEKGENIKQVWLYHVKPFEDAPDYITQSKWASLSMIYHMATAKVWVDSHTKPVWIKKRKKQYYIETWHGGLGIKKIEGDATDKLPKEIIKRIKHNSKMTDILISNSDWLTDIYKRAFFYNGTIIKVGYPKTDYLLNLPEGIKEKVYEFYKIDANTKYLLYVPTMRDKPKKETFHIETKDVIKTLKEKFGGEWKILIRLHPVNRVFTKEMSLGEDVIDATEYNDILELIVASDIVLTDYSSCIFDAAIIKKKAMIFASDEEEYNHERGLYLKLEDLPFLVSRNNHELIENIKNFDSQKYNDEIEKYFEKVGLFEKGTATETIIKIIKEKMRE